MDRCGCVPDKDDADTTPTNRDLAIKKYSAERADRLENLTTPVYDCLLDLLAWRFSLPVEEVRESVLDSAEGVAYLVSLMSKKGELAVAATLREGPALKLSCGRTPPFPESPQLKRVLIQRPRDLKSFGLGCVLVYRTSNDFDADEETYSERYNYLFPNSVEDMVNFPLHHIYAFRSVLQEVDLAEQVPEHLRRFGRNFVTSFEQDMDDNVASLDEIAQDFPHTLKLATVFLVDEQGDSGSKKRVRDVRATVEHWIATLQEYYEKEILSFPIKLPRKTSAQIKIDYWLRMKSAYEKAILRLDDDYLLQTVEEVRDSNPEIYLTWTTLTSTIADRYENLMHHFSHFAMLQKMLTELNQAPLDHLKALLRQLTQEIETYTRYHGDGSAFVDIVSVILEIDVKTIFIKYLLPNPSNCIWKEDQTLVDNKIKNCVDYLKTMKVAMRKLYLRISNKTTSEKRAMAQLNKFIGQKKTWFTFIPVIFSLNTTVSQKLAAREKVVHIEYSEENEAWERKMRSVICEANAILREALHTVGNPSLGQMFGRDAGKRVIVAYVRVIESADEVFKPVMQEAILSAKSLAHAMHYLDLFCEVLDLSKPMFAGVEVNNHFASLFRWELEILEEYFRTNRESPVDMVRDQPLPWAKVMWAENLVLRFNELLDKLKSLPVDRQVTPDAKFDQLVPDIRSYQKECFLKWQIAAGEKVASIRQGPILAQEYGEYQIQDTSNLTQIISLAERFQTRGYEISCGDVRWALKMKHVLQMLRDQVGVINAKSKEVKALLPPYFRQFMQPQLDRVEAILKEAAVWYSWRQNHSQAYEALSQVAVFWTQAFSFWTEIMRIKTALIDEPSEEIGKVKVGYVPSDESMSLEDWVITNRMFDRDQAAEKLQVMSFKVRQAVPVIMTRIISQYDSWFPGDAKYKFMQANKSARRLCGKEKEFTVNTLKLEAQKVFIFLKSGLDNAMQRCLITYLCDVVRVLEGIPSKDKDSDEGDENEGLKFDGEMLFIGDKFRVRPCMELVGELVLEILFRALTVFNNVKNWEEYEEGDASPAFPETAQPSLRGYLAKFFKSKDFAKTHYWFSSMVTRQKLAADLLVQIYMAQFSFLFAKDQTKFAKKIIDWQPSAKKIHNIIRGYRKGIPMLESLSDFYEIGSFQIETKEVMVTLVTRAEDWFELLSKYFEADWARKLHKVYGYLTSHIKVLKAPIADIRDIKRKMKAMQDTRDNLFSLRAALSHVQHVYRTFKKFELRVIDADRDKVRKLKSKYDKLNDLGLETVQKLLEVQEAFTRSIAERSQAFDEKVAKFEQEFVVKGPLDPKITQKEACARFYNMKSKLYELYEEYQDLLDAQKLFGLPTKEYPTLSEKQEQFLVLDKLYGMYLQITNSLEEYYKVPWSEVDIEKVKTEILDYQAKLLKVPKHMRDFAVYDHMTSLVDDFNETIPLLVLMADKSMLPRHWKRLEVLTGHTFNVESKEFNLKNIIEANVLAYKDDVEDICVSAIKEKDIEAKLNQLISDWSQVNLTFAPFKERGDLFLKPPETSDIIAQIEDSIMVIASLAANRYNAPFKATILDWLKNLSNSLEILESWLQIQNIWGYLEAVFSGGEISRQLPAEATKFQVTDKNFVRLITKAKVTKNAIKACTGEETMKTELAQIAQELEECQKSLSGYLEQKRGYFPRFFFVSDPTLLEILGQATDSHMIQPKLLDVFENIAELRFSPTEYDLITGIISMEKQEIALKKPVLAVEGVENWLNNLLHESRNSLHEIILECWTFMESREFQGILEMVNEFIAQVGLLGIQIYWTFRAEYALAESVKNSRIMKSINDEFLVVLNTFIDQTTKDLSRVERTKFETLVTIHVHQRDIFDEMVTLNILNPNDFQWLKQARFYIDEESNCVVKITDVDFIYQNEYLGCQERLVVTPLTDRCYITCAQAIGMNLGAAPAGPAGTGKTETTKDMGRTLGKYVVVFNCSDQMDFRGLGRIFKGLAQSGSWGCFDEFNRIELPVLSVAAQQIGLLLTARREEKTSFVFSDGETCSLNPEFGLFITMNPGYAGRQELPENIKYQFRSVSMMVPDRQIIKRVRLAASGFKDNVYLARKFFTLYALCEEQLSKQVHYDFGLRNILSVLRTLGSQKRADPTQSEEKVVMRVLRDMNVSKLVDEDEPLFLSLIDDLFVGLTLSSSVYVELQAAIEKACVHFDLINHPTWNLKVVQMYETSLVRHGLMLLGPTGSGKSCIIKSLMAALSTCGTFTFEMRMNPKAITAPQMFGRLDVATNDWTDGIFSVLWRKCHKVDKNKVTWLVLDGPVDAVWIENLNSVLDDNKTLTLANGDRIKMAPNSKLVFEPDNVDNASPATVSRMGMTFVSASVLPWKPCFEGWCKSRPSDEGRVFHPLFNQLYGDLLLFLQSKLKPKMALLEALYIRQTCDMLAGLIQDPKKGEPRKLDKDHYEKCFMFALMWSLGAVLEMDDRKKFETFVMGHKSKLNWPKPSGEDTIFEFKVTQDGRWEHWNSSVADYIYPAKSVPDFLDILVPNVDNQRTNFLIETIARLEKNVLLIGEPGTAKTVMIKGYMKTYNPEIHLSKSFNFSSATTPNMVQRIIESYLEKRSGTIYGPPNFRKMSIFIDDISMPVFNDWGDQVTNEITRQLMEQGGFFSLDKPGEFSHVQGIQILAAMIHPGGGRNDIPPRLKRRFCIFNCSLPSNKSMDRIFSSIGIGYFSHSRFSKDIVDFLPNFVRLTRSIWQQTKQKMLPTPAKFHYIFNLRDLSRIWQGMCNIKGDEVKKPSVLYKLWRHECMRTISDRFISQGERDWFADNLEVNAKKELGDQYSSLDLDEAIFVDFLREPPEPVGDEEVVIPKVYELVPSIEELRDVLTRFQKQYNNLTKGLPMDLVFFKDFIYHLIIISRIIRTPRGNALLVGVGGSGKQSVTRLSTFIANYEMRQIVLTRTYNVSNLMDDIKVLYRIAGAQGKGVTFIFTDNDIKDETFLEPINNILSSGEVANLFPKDELDEILTAMIPLMKKVDSKRPPTQDNLYDFFISQAKNNLHVTLCFSPVGEKFRSRALMFPGLVSGCTVDWYYKWPPDALAAVSEHFLTNYSITGTAQTIASLMHMMGDTHTIVSSTLTEYFEKFRRQSFVTPKSFLAFLESYKALYAVRRKRIDKDAYQREIGLQKLEEAAVSVEQLRKELVIKEKNIAVATAAADVILKSVSIKAAAAELVKSEVEVVKAKAQELVDVIAADKKVAEGKLKAAEPALAAAEAALATIKPADINTVKALKTPPYAIQIIMDCVLILVKDKLAPVEYRADQNLINPSWAEAGKLLSNVQFLSKLMNFKKDCINDETIDLMEPYLRWPKYTLEYALSVCGQVAGLLSWTIAMKDFYKVNKEVLPLKANLAIQQVKLDQAMIDKDRAEAILAAKNKEVAAAKAQLDTAEKAKKEVMDEGNACKAKMDAATGLITGLAGEQVRWTEQATEFRNQLLRLVGDSLVLCGFLCYAGPFNQEYRTKIRERWYHAMVSRKIPFTQDLNITENLVDQPTISEWNLQGLPTDDLSTQNGIIVTQASRYPLLIDPQGQGITWIKNRERSNHLIVTSISNKYFRQHLEDALVDGKPMLIAEILEELDPVLDNVLEKNFVKQGSKYKLRLGDKDLEVLPFQFRLYITTKLANPSYTPEVSARCSIIDFTVTLKGLEDQLLARVILKERRELEDERLYLMKDVTLNKRKTIELEQNLLHKLTTVKGSLVDDESVLKTLNVTKDTAIQVRRKIQIAYDTEKEINIAREAFRPVANRGSILYFLICDMSLVNYMYQTSLGQFLERFDISMDRSVKSERVSERISIIIDFLTDDVFRYKVRGLYEEHKFMFPLLLTLRIDLDRKTIHFPEFNYLLKGGAALELGNCPPKPASWITDISWLNICELNRLPPFTDFIEQVKTNEKNWKIWYGKPAPEEEVIPKYNNLKPFYRLLIVRAWCPDRTLMESKKYITQSLGPQYSDPVLFNMEAMVIESRPRTPLINFLSMGSDPTVEIETLARKLRIPCQSISMGQAQEIHARKLIDSFVVQGGWALLQNCHLGLEYMTELFGYLQRVERCHPDFRVWITTEPHLGFPMSLLQISIKFTSQPPAGLRAGLKRTYVSMSAHMFNYSPREEYPYLLFTTSFLHTVVQERRKFGPLGWNIPYEFNYADWYASCLFMQNHCDSLSKKDTVSWVTVRYMISEVQYGGRVTDDYDKRLLNTFAAVWFSADVYSNLDFSFYPGYPLMRYRESTERYLEAIDFLPQNDPPPVYCLHPNADITYQTNTTNNLLNTIIEIQPKESAGDGASESRETVVARIAKEMLTKLPPMYEVHVCRERYKSMGATKPLVIVLRQEVDRMQKVIRTVSTTLKDLLLAVDGAIIMNENLKDSLDNIFDARVPTSWKRGSWLSSSLGFWFTELLDRNEQLHNWLNNGRPEQFWMTGFFNPQGFLTAMKQEVARSNHWPLDLVNITNAITTMYREGVKAGPDEGVFVYGLFLEGATWDRKKMLLTESQPKILNTLMPVFHISASNKPYMEDPKLYTSPVYKKPGRTGLNFITKLWIPCEVDTEPHWILRAVALLCDTK